MNPLLHYMLYVESLCGREGLSPRILQLGTGW